MFRIIARSLVVLTLLTSGAALAQTASPDLPEAPQDQQGEAPMTLARMAGIIRALDPDMRVQGPAMEFTLEDIPVIVITDVRADRMRAMVPIASVEGLTQADLLRLMQANFDAALDARYAVAHGRLWGSSFIRCHRLKRISSCRVWSRRSPWRAPMAPPIPAGRQYSAAATAARSIAGCWRRCAKRARSSDPGGRTFLRI
ncbi:hypothetical protein ACFQFQ_05910 [Sulfitobacter porphyrae]|uniref:Uncharacterized protein n=1 Tax=Sulfitobacter porphyrae TaxID=1246864 RepID=A0ABW2B295_9RHOB